MLEIIVAAVLIAFGLLSIYFSVEGELKDSGMLIVLLLGVAAIVGGGWIILTKVTLAMILAKLAGLILAGAGLFLMFGFPDINPDYQREGMSKFGVFAGLILLIIGAYLLFF